MTLLSQQQSPFHSSQRILELDGIRGLAILLILIWHYVTLQLVEAPNQDWPLVRSVVQATLLSWSGVDLFFVLSGFLIAGILFDHRHSANYFQVFYLRRICRIFPAYYLQLILFAAAVALAPAPRSASLSWLLDQTMPAWSYATFTQNFAMAHEEHFGANWLAITWSLAIEEQFYLLFPLIVRYTSSAFLPWVLWGGFIGAPILRTGLGTWPAFLWMPCRMDALFVGALLAYYVRQPRWLDRLRQIPTTVYLVGLVIFAVYVVEKVDSALLNPHNKMLLAMFYGALLLVILVDQQSIMAKALRAGWLRWLGRVSFGIYLMHYAMIGLAYSLLGWSGPRITTLLDGLVTVAVLSVTLLLAHVLYEKFEKPILTIGHRYHYRNP